MRLILSFVIILVSLGCNSPKSIKYSFLVAGHPYVKPLKEDEKAGLNPYLMNKIPFIIEQKNIEMGFLLGDIVWTPNLWPKAEKDIDSFNMSMHIVRGNHDGSHDFFKNKFGYTYKKFIYKDNLYIILDSIKDKWSILGDQLTFLQNTLKQDGKNAQNIFIMAHHLLWFSKEKFPIPIPNSTAGRVAGETNFWTVIEPLLKSQQKPIFLFAGDMGAFKTEKRYPNQKKPMEFFYHNYENITFIGTGMGGGLRDNLIIVDVLKDNSVLLNLIHLNGKDINGLGKLEDYLKFDLKKNK